MKCTGCGKNGRKIHMFKVYTISDPPYNVDYKVHLCNGCMYNIVTHLLDCLDLGVHRNSVIVKYGKEINRKEMYANSTTITK